MKQEAKYRIKTGIANTFGTLGYLVGFLQWLWAIVLYLSLIQSTTSFISDQGGAQVAPPTDLSIAMPGPLGVIILGVTVVVMIAISIYAIIAVPKTIVKASNKLVHKTAETVAPAVLRAQHKKDTKRMRIKLTAELTLLVKFLLILLPFIATVSSRLLETQFIEYAIALLVGGVLAGVATLLFVIQYLLGLILRVKITELT